MKSSPTCLTCGASLACDSSEGLCPACMLRTALYDGSEEATFPVEPDANLPRSFGPYELMEEIARGGMGVVYKARQVTLDRTVALKVLIGGAFSSEALLRRFRVEAEAAAGLQHPGIVSIHEFGEYDNQPYFTMDYVEGKNLSEVAKGQPIAPVRAARYLQAIAEAVSFAHQQGILHRDLKPSNVLIDENDRPRVADFGLAKRVGDESDLTLAGQMLGSPNYAPPEQAAGRQDSVGVRSDVYALGGLLYFLLTGRPPFLASTVRETLRLVFETDPISPRVLNPDVPHDLDTICLKCLEKYPERRYDSAQALADELKRFMKGEPISARPISSAERTVRWCRRHPAIASLAATVVAALTATSVIFYSSGRRIEHARALEQAARVEAEENLYASNMNWISSSATMPAGTDLRTALLLLNAARPKSGERDLRGFEWRYYWSIAQSGALAVLKGHADVVNAVSFAPDGAHLVTHSRDGVLKVWDAATMREIHSLDGAFVLGGFTANGAQLVFSRPDNSLWAIDLTTWNATQVRVKSGRLIAALPDGRHVVVFGPDYLPVLRAADDPIIEEKYPDVPPDVCAVVSANGRRAAVASPPGRPYPSILVIDLSTRRQVAAFVDPRPVIALALSPDGTQLVSSGFDGVLKVWDVERGALERTFKAFLDPVWGMAFSADGQSFAAGGNNRDLKIWSTIGWEEKEKMSGHSTTVLSVAFSPDGRRLVSGAEDELAMVWPAHSQSLPTEMPQLLRGPEWIDRTPGIAFSPDSRLFAGTAADGTVKVWRTDTIETVATYPMDARTVAFSPDGKSVLGEGYDGIVNRWALDGQNPEQTIRPKAIFANWQVAPLTSQERVTLVADQPETRAVCHTCEISSTRDGINAGAMLTSPALAISSDGRTMYIGLPQGGVEIWDMASRQARKTISAHKLPVTALATSPDGRYFASGSLDNSTVLWDAATGQHVATYYSHNRPVWALAFSPDSKTLAAGSCDKQIILCSVPLRRAVAFLPLYVGLPKGYEQEVRLLRFSPDGNILAAGLGDGTVRFFRAAPFSQTDAKPAENLTASY